MEGLTIAGLYLCGCMLAWVNFYDTEMTISMTIGEAVEMIPWQKTLGTALWPFVAIWLFTLLVKSYFTKGVEDLEDDE